MSRHPRHVYVHVPFCARRCSYCDFSIAVRRTVPMDEYLSALAHEVALRVPDGGPWPVDTLYLGGGTPSLLGGVGAARLLDILRRRLVLEAGAEVTLEANPDDVTPEAVRAWCSAGVNRLSIGSQSFDARVLSWMHRSHAPEQIERAVDAAHAGGIEDFSLDLIFALPAELRRDWGSDVARALALAPPHLSLYGLTVEPATPLGRWRDRGAVREAPEELYEGEFLRAHEMLVAAGYEHYEVSNYARPGHRSRHNASYWRRVPYAGFGPSAHSFSGTRRRWNTPAYAAWVRALSEGRDPVEGTEVLDCGNHRAEQVYLGLRTSEGVAMDSGMAPQVQPWIEAGWAAAGGGRLRLTATGWLRLDAIATSLTHSTSCC